MAGVQRYEDLHVWQLSVKLRDAIFTMTETGKAAKDFTFRGQIRERLRRLQETRTLLQEGQSKKYFAPDEVNRLLRVQARAAKAAVRLIQYLEKCPEDFDSRRDSEPRTEP